MGGRRNWTGRRSGIHRMIKRWIASQPLSHGGRLNCLERLWSRECVLALQYAAAQTIIPHIQRSLLSRVSFELGPLMSYEQVSISTLPYPISFSSAFSAPLTWYCITHQLQHGANQLLRWYDDVYVEDDWLDGDETEAYSMLKSSSHLVCL